MSLRTRLLLGILALVSVGLLAADVATYRFLRSSLIERVDERLAAGTFSAARALSDRDGVGRDGGPDHPPGGGPFDLLPSGTYAAFLDPEGGVIQETSFTFGEKAPPPPVLPGDLPGSTAGGAVLRELLTADATDGSTSYRVLAEPLAQGAGTLVVAIPLDDVTATLRRLLTIEAAVTLAVLLGVALVALWLVRRGLRPLARMGETAGAIAAGDLSRRVETTDPRTEVGRLGQALNAMLSQIERAFDERTRSEERLRRFVADASHELRTPLTSIRGYAELFRRGASERPEDLAMTMRRIEEEGSRMGKLVEELLLLARLDQGRPLDRERVDLAEVVGASVEGARAADPARPITLTADGAVGVLGDGSRLRQAIDNLLTNAREHTPPGTPVHVGLRSEGESAVLTVRDEGPGIDPSDAARVFERFYRADASRSRDRGGVGLGLSIVAAVVEVHGGSVTCEPAPGGGALFRIVLPRAGQAGPPRQPESPDPGAARATTVPEEVPTGADSPA